MRLTTLDFETLPIERRPDFPPKPVGVAIKRGRRPARYFAFGHPSGNNSNPMEVHDKLCEVLDSGDLLLFHNAKFDCAVLEEQLKIRVPWERVHDTLPLVFLDDPRAETFSLKPTAERLLKLPPSERDAVSSWLIEHQPFSKKRITKASAAKFIGYAPGNVVAPYAIGDVDRTFALFELLFPRIKRRGMLEAYDRELQLLPILHEIEKHGVRVDTDRLERDVTSYSHWLTRLDSWIANRLGRKDLNVDSGADLAQALLSAGAAKEEDLGVTKKGTIQTNRAAIGNAVKDKQLSAVLRYRGALRTCLSTFLAPWLTTAARTGGLIFTDWSSVRGIGETASAGASTGRLCSSPNFQNLPKTFAPLFYCREERLLPKSPLPKLPTLPVVRSYVIPRHRGHVLADRDYSQQELRILAHFEDGKLLEAYRENPRLDVHEFVRTLINERLGTKYERKPVKNTVFGLLYGMGVGKLAEKNNLDVAKARSLRTAVLNEFPGVRELYAVMRKRAADNEPIRTWGGRLYYCEPAALVDGRIRSFDYKLVNVLIQGSAADCTKEALVRWWKVRDPEDRLLLTAHDEVLLSVPRRRLKEAMSRLRVAMESIPFAVPMLSDGATSRVSWADLQPYKEKTHGTA